VQINVNLAKRTDIEPGDVVLNSSGNAYMLVDNHEGTYQYSYVDLQNGHRVNGFKTLEHLNRTRDICLSAGQVVRVIKNKNIMLDEKEC
jgi:hypothetical protein